MADAPVSLDPFLSFVDSKGYSQNIRLANLFVIDWSAWVRRVVHNLLGPFALAESSNCEICHQPNPNNPDPQHMEELVYLEMPSEGYPLDEFLA